jgi:hypothetical protein
VPGLLMGLLAKLPPAGAPWLGLLIYPPCVPEGPEGAGGLAGAAGELELGEAEGDGAIAGAAGPELGGFSGAAEPAVSAAFVDAGACGGFKGCTGAGAAGRAKGFRGLGFAAAEGLSSSEGLGRSLATMTSLRLLHCPAAAGAMPEGVGLPWTWSQCVCILGTAMRARPLFDSTSSALYMDYGVIEYATSA